MKTKKQVMWIVLAQHEYSKQSYCAGVFTSRVSAEKMIKANSGKYKKYWLEGIEIKKRF